LVECAAVDVEKVAVGPRARGGEAMMAARARRAAENAASSGKTPKRLRLAAGGAGEHGLLLLSLALAWCGILHSSFAAFCGFENISELELEICSMHEAPPHGSPGWRT
jgi:hypothetical protein